MSKAQPTQKGTPAPARSRAGVAFLLLLLLLLLLGGLLAVLALDLQTVRSAELAPGLLPGDFVLLDKLSAELGRVGAGEMVVVRSRSKGRVANPVPLLRQVVATEGGKVKGQVVERGHMLITPARESKSKYEKVPVGDVLAVARLRIREKGERWAVDTLPP